MVQAGLRKYRKIAFLEIFCRYTKSNITNHVQVWSQVQNKDNNVVLEQTQHNHLCILICHVYSMHQEGGAVLQHNFAEFYEVEVKICKNVAKSNAKKYVLFSVGYLPEKQLLYTHWWYAEIWLPVLQLLLVEFYDLGAKILHGCCTWQREKYYIFPFSISVVFLEKSA